MYWIRKKRRSKRHQIFISYFSISIEFDFSLDFLSPVLTYTEKMQFNWHRMFAQSMMLENHKYEKCAFAAKKRHAKEINGSHLLMQKNCWIKRCTTTTNSNKKYKERQLHHAYTLRKIIISNSMYSVHQAEKNHDGGNSTWINVNFTMNRTHFFRWSSPARNEKQSALQYTSVFVCVVWRWSNCKSHSLHPSKLFTKQPADKNDSASFEILENSSFNATKVKKSDYEISVYFIFVCKKQKKTNRTQVKNRKWNLFILFLLGDDRARKAHGLTDVSRWW